jgi:hypothetical protein
MFFGICEPARLSTFVRRWRITLRANPPCELRLRGRWSGDRGAPRQDQRRAHAVILDWGTGARLAETTHQFREVFERRPVAMWGED